MSTTTNEFDSLRQLAFELCGATIGEERSYLIEARLAPLIAQTASENYTDLENKIRADVQGNLRDEFIDLITTHETLWFRDHRPWRCIEEVILPNLFQKAISSPFKKIRIWSAAASTGQEIYSLALLISNLSSKPNWQGKVSLENFEIIASDVAASTIQKAQEAKYNKVEISRGLPDFYIEKFFTTDGFYSCLHDEIKNQVQFKVFNLMSPFMFGQFDFILCRNVLIYFSQEDKLKLYKKFENSLNPEGYFMLGGSESMIGYSSPLHRKIHADAVYHQK